MGETSVADRQQDALAGQELCSGHVCPMGTEPWRVLSSAALKRVVAMHGYISFHIHRDACSWFGSQRGVSNTWCSGHALIQV